MIKFENTEVLGWETAIRGMRNPMNSWEKSDSGDSVNCGECGIVDRDGICKPAEHRAECEKHREWYVGPNDLDLMKRLRNAGSDHRKFMRMITVYVDITAPLYWWKEFDTYKVGTVANSCSTMHKIADKKFTTLDFSEEHLLNGKHGKVLEPDGNEITMAPNELLGHVINHLNIYRELYLKTKDKKYWWQMIQLLPSSYNQKRTVMLNYEVLANIYKSRKNHKLDEWSLTSFDESNKLPNDTFVYGFCDWIRTLPYSELITGEEDQQ